MPAVPRYAAFGKPKASEYPAGFAGSHSIILIEFVDTNGDGFTCKHCAFFMQLDDGQEYPALSAFPAAGIERILLPFDKRREHIRKMLIAVCQYFKGNEYLLQARVETRLQKIVGELASSEPVQVL